jgi:glycosyltransferase involved in cell wall biosynthesis
VAGPLTYRLLHGPGYRRNVSLRRSVDQFILAGKFRRYSSAEAKPDIIISSYPLQETSYEAVRYGRRETVPVILDIRDLIPDVMIDVIPPILAPFGRVAISPLVTLARRTLRGATALTGITPEFVKWGASCAGRDVQPLDQDFPLAYDPSSPPEDVLERARQKWRAQGLTEADLIISMVGYLGSRRLLDMETVLLAAREMKGINPNIKFVLCGPGDSLEYYRNLALGCDNILLPGWVDRAESWVLLRMSSFGILPYASTYSFMMSYPTKLIEFASAGLPVVSSLRGATAKLLDEWNCGITYPNNDPAALVRILTELAKNREKTNEMRVNAAKMYAALFHPDLVYPKMVEHAERVREAYVASHRVGS